jgi:mediator of RNA polymerase II transcription subunit 12
MYIPLTFDTSSNISSLDTLLCLLRAHQSILIQPKLSQLTLSRLLTTLGRLLIMPTLGPYSSLTTQIFDTIALLSDFASAETNSHCILVLRNQHHIQDIRLQFLFGYPDHEDGDFIRLVSVPNGGASADPKAKPGPAGIAPDPGQSQAFPLRRWEMVQDATPIIGENDTSLSLSLFGARKSVL